MGVCRLSQRLAASGRLRRAINAIFSVGTGIWRSRKRSSAGSRSGHAGRWGDAIGSLQVALTLQPGETREIAFTLGAADS